MRIYVRARRKGAGCRCHKCERKTFLRLRQRLNSWVTIAGIGSALHSIHIHYYNHFECVTHLQRLLHGDRREARELSKNPKCNSIFIGVDFSLFLFRLNFAVVVNYELREYLGCLDSSAFKTYRRDRIETKLVDVS